MTDIYTPGRELVVPDLQTTHRINNADTEAITLPYGFDLRRYQVDPWQALVVDNVNRALLCQPRRNGKDILSLNILVAKSQQRVGLYFYMAPYYTQARSIIWNGSDGAGRRFLDYIPPQLIRRKHEAEMRIELWNGSQIRINGSDNIDSIVGNNPVGIVFTEFSLHKREAWDYMRPVLAENGGWALFNGTPRGLNHFYTQLEAAKRDPENWYWQHITRDDTGIPSLEAIERERRAGMPESLIRQEYYCSFTASSDETLIPLDILEPTTSTSLSMDQFQHEPRIMGVDVAFAVNGDEAIVAKRQGRMLHPLKAFQGLDNMGLASHIAKEINTWHPAAVFIDAGRGEGVISRLHQLGFSSVVIPVNFGGTPSTDLYHNKASEMWFKTREWVNPTEGLSPAFPDDEKLIAQLSSRMFELDEKNKLKIETKKALKKRGHPSPDRADAVVLTFAEEAPRDRIGEMAREMGVPRNMIIRQTDGNEDYDPMNFLNKEDDDGPSEYDRFFGG